MKLRVIFLSLFVLLSFNRGYLFAQITANSPTISYEISNLDGNNNVLPSIQIHLDFGKDIQDDISINNGQNEKLNPFQVKFYYHTKESPLLLEATGSRMMRKGFALIFEIKSKSEVEWLYEDKRPFDFHLSENISLDLSNGSKLDISQDSINNLGSFYFELDDMQKKSLINGLEKFTPIYYNKFDVGWRESSSDSTSNENYLEFAKAFKFPGTENFFIELEGLLSTDINDVAAYLQVSPLNFRLGKSKKLHVNASYQTSTNQDEQRVMGRISWRGLIDSPVDNIVANLSTGTNRIRLKPYLNAGLSVMYFTQSENAQLKEGRFIEPFVSFLYIIPIADKYTARLDTYAYWRSTKDKLDLLTENINWQGTIQIEYGIGSNAQIVGKYSYGTFGLTNETNNRLMFGFATELFKRLN